MSTKVTLLYGVAEVDGEENDYHLYYDYIDGEIHLEIKGKEVELPPKLRQELKHIFALYSMAINLFSKLAAIAEYRGDVEAEKKIIASLGKTAFGRSIFKDQDEEEVR